jgi:hypothetical protein
MGIQYRKELLTYDDEGGWNLAEEYRRSWSDGAYGPYNRDDRCFYCSDHLSGEAVLYWMGCNTRNVDAKKNPDLPSWRKETRGGQDLLLHPGCFLELITRLFHDLHQIELKIDYRVLKNASPAPPRPEGDARTKEGWKIWRKLRDAMRDLTVVNQ